MTELDKVMRKIKKPISMDKILDKVMTTGMSRDESINFINNKIASYEIIKTPNNNYIPINKTSYKVGIYHRFRNGDGNVSSGDSKYFVAKEDAVQSIDGDIVLVDTYIPAGQKNKSCRISKVLKRDLNSVIGEITKIGNSYYVVCEDKNKSNLTILLEGNNYIEGEKVIVSCEDKRSDNFYVGTVIKSIGHKDDPGVDILMEAYKYGIDNDISEEVLKEVAEIPTEVSDVSKIGRMDLTDKEIFTIDGDDTKDIDDAISLEILDNGNYLLGVHIADVTNYVKRDSKLYQRARDKATSSYLVNTVIPMLPHKLSNGICSLNPGAERLSMSCVMEFDKEGNLISHNIWQSVIKSNLQMTYKKVNDILDKNIIDDKYIKHVDTLKNMNKLAKILNAKRVKRGSVELNRPELKLIFDENGEVVDFSKRSQGTGEHLIEEFMLAANETVATHMSKYPFIYRVHDIPDTEKMQDFINMLNLLGYKFNGSVDDPRVGQDLAKFLDTDDPLSSMLKTQLLRTFKKAVYSPENIGHYGLASECYCHFTSPIRRFPDTTVHQLIKDFEFSDEDKMILKNKWEHELVDISRNSSTREKNADECERMVLLMKCAEYMSKHIGEEYTGTVVSMDTDGIYVELDNMIDGKIRIKDLPGYYLYNENTYSFVSTDGYDDYYLGDRLNLKVSYADKEKKEINFKVAGKLEENTRINKKINEHLKVLEKQRKANEMYYNVNKGRKK